MPDEAIPNLRQRMALAMADIGRVAKTGKNEKQGYDYTKADDIITEVRAALIKHGIAFLANEVGTKRLPDRESRSGGAILAVEVNMEFCLLDTTSEEQLVGHGTGEGMDSGDKAINKAKTAALKYFLQQTFLIPTGDDPEKDDFDVKHNARVNDFVNTPATEDYSRNPWVEDGKPKLATMAQRGALVKLAKKVRAPENPDMGMEHLKTRMADFNVTKETITPEQVQTITAELKELDAALKGVAAPAEIEDADIGF